MIRFYAKRLERDLKRWHEKGWVTGEGYRAILAEQRQGSKLTASAALAGIGAILLGFAAMSFVAANWSEIPRIFRVAMLLAGLWTAYGSAAYLYKRELPDFAQAAVLTGSLVFGAAVMLVSQMYHIDSGNLPGFMFLWMSGAAAAGVLFRSSLTLGCALLLAGAWHIAEWDAMPHGVHWHFLPVWAVLTGADCLESLRHRFARRGGRTRGLDRSHRIRPAFQSLWHRCRAGSGRRSHGSRSYGYGHQQFCASNRGSRHPLCHFCMLRRPATAEPQ